MTAILNAAINNNNDTSIAEINLSPYNTLIKENIKSYFKKQSDTDASMSSHCKYTYDNLVKDLPMFIKSLQHSIFALPSINYTEEIKKYAETNNADNEQIEAEIENPKFDFDNLDDEFSDDD